MEKDIDIDWGYTLPLKVHNSRSCQQISDIYHQIWESSGPLMICAPLSFSTAVTRVSKSDKSGVHSCISSLIWLLEQEEGQK